MQAYQKILDNMLDHYKEDLDKIIAGNFEDYYYKQAYEKEQGTYDANYSNRTRLCYALLYKSEKLSPEKKEALVRSLFQEELKDRETNSFQGIGTNLEILTQLLNKYKTKEDEELFKRTKQANFDCYCGYDYEDYNAYPADFTDFSLENSISIALDLKETSTARELISLWTNSKKELTKDELRTLSSWESWISDNQEQELGVLKELEKKEKNPWEICSTKEKILRKLIELERWDEAHLTFLELFPILESAKKDWWQIGLGRFVLEDGMDLINHIDGKQSKALWDLLVPFLKLALSSMHGNLYQKAANAAKKQNDQVLSEQFLEQYQKLMQL